MIGTRCTPDHCAGHRGVAGPVPRRAPSSRTVVVRAVPATPAPASDDAVARPPHPILPSPSNVKASVQLVPKRKASAALLRGASATQLPAEDGDAVSKFLLKCRLAWNLFFPPTSETGGAAAARVLNPKDLGKQRLQMILVADRCGLSPSSLVEMKRNTLAALADCMELDELQDAHLRFTMTREGGTTYSMAVPILREGPYSDDGSVVGQSAAAAATAAAASAAEVGEHGAGTDASALSSFEDVVDEYDDREEHYTYSDESYQGDESCGAAVHEQVMYQDQEEEPELLLCDPGTDGQSMGTSSLLVQQGDEGTDDIGGDYDGAVWDVEAASDPASAEQQTMKNAGQPQEGLQADVLQTAHICLTPSPAATATESLLDKQQQLQQQQSASGGSISGVEQSTLRQQLHELLVDELLHDVEALAAAQQQQMAPSCNAACAADAAVGVSAVAAAAAALAALTNNAGGEGVPLHNNAADSTADAISGGMLELPHGVVVGGASGALSEEQLRAAAAAEVTQLTGGAVVEEERTSQ